VVASVGISGLSVGLALCAGFFRTWRVATLHHKIAMKTTTAKPPTPPAMGAGEIEDPDFCELDGTVVGREPVGRVPVGRVPVGRVPVGRIAVGLWPRA
jgi:hypothetical protein